MNYYHNLDQQKVLHFASLKSGETMVIVVPLKEQPPEGCKFLNGSLYNDFKEYAYFWNEKTDECWKTKLPYSLNARVGMRETWGEEVYKPYGRDEEVERRWRYKADGMPALIYKYHLEFKWRSAQSMPTEAIRYWGKVTDVRVDRVQNLTSREVMDLTAESDNVLWRLWDVVKNWFNTHYSKPIPRYKNGEIDHYECWLFSTDDIQKLKNNYDYLYPNYMVNLLNSNGYPKWKGKPFIVHIDPQCEVATLEKE